MFNFIDFQTKKISFIVEIISKVNFKLLTTLICFVFLGTSIYKNLESLADQTVALKETLWLLGGIVFSFSSIIINAYAWKLFIDSVGCNSNKLDIVQIFLKTNIYKYLPGGIWHFVSRYNILRLKYSSEKSAEFILLEPLLMLVAGLIFIPFGSHKIYIFIFCWSSTLVFLTGFRKFLIKNLKKIKANIFKNNGKVREYDLFDNNQQTSKKICYPYKSLFVEIIFLFFRFFGFLCCMNAFSIGSVISQSELISTFSLAWIIGLVVPAAPGGVGIFESVIIFILGSKFPEGSLLAALLCYRLVSTISDVFASLVYPVRKLLKV